MTKTRKFKAGDKVRIKVNAWDIVSSKGMTLNHCTKDMIGKVYEINSVSERVASISGADKSETWLVPPEAIELADDELRTLRNMEVGDIMLVKGVVQNLGKGGYLVVDFGYGPVQVSLKDVQQPPSITIKGKQYESTTELERLKGEFDKLQKTILGMAYADIPNNVKGAVKEFPQALDRYYQARKELEEYISKLKEI